jgi:ABC-type uncharacterized transport system substrate-binding protein
LADTVFECHESGGVAAWLRQAVYTAPTGSATAANTTIPIVFNTAGDPVQMGLVASLNRPGGNVTGVANLHMQLAALLDQP